MVYTSTGTRVATYSYTAYGTMTVSMSGIFSHPAVAKHSVAYRGYFYDKDLGLYYCNSRYYDQKICRFISPDTEAVITATPMGLTDKNLYAYCDNNPVMRIDRDGEFWNLLIGAGVGAIVGAVASITSQLINDPSSWQTGDFWSHVGVSASTGAVSGGLAASGIGLLGQVVGNAVLSGVGGIADAVIDGETSADAYVLRGIEGLAFGLIAGFIGGRGSASKHVSNSFWRMVFSGTDDLTYYFSQIGKQAIRDGIKAIPSIIKATAPTVTKALIKAGVEYLK